MSGKRRRIYEAIHANPVRANISWNDVVALVEGLGGLVVGKGGSMFSLELNGASTIVHRPHPGNELTRPGVRAIRNFLADAGVGIDDL